MGHFALARAAAKASVDAYRYKHSSGSLSNLSNPMTTRLAIRRIDCTSSSGFAARCPGASKAPQQSQSQQLPQTTKGAPQAAMMQASMSDVSDGLKRFISGYAAKSADKKFHVPYSVKISRWTWSKSTTIGSRILAAINISPVST